MIAKIKHYTMRLKKGENIMNGLRKYLVEFIGTFFLVFTVGCTAYFAHPGVIAPIAIGAALMVMVYAGGHISGGHYNPAVSLAAAIRGRLEWRDFIPYIIAQFLGGSLGALTVILSSGTRAQVPGCPFGVGTMIIAEFIVTFALCYVVLLSATCERTAGNSYFGLAIGSTVMVGAFAVGGVLCYGAFNPSVALALGTLGASCWAYIFITMGANLLGGIAAALVYKFVSYRD